MIRTVERRLLNPTGGDRGIAHHLSLRDLSKTSPPTIARCRNNIHNSKRPLPKYNSDYVKLIVAVDKNSHSAAVRPVSPSPTPPTEEWRTENTNQRWQKHDQRMAKRPMVACLSAYLRGSVLYYRLVAWCCTSGSCYPSMFGASSPVSRCVGRPAAALMSRRSRTDGRTDERPTAMAPTRMGVRGWQHKVGFDRVSKTNMS